VERSNLNSIFLQATESSDDSSSQADSIIEEIFIVQDSYQASSEQASPSSSTSSSLSESEADSITNNSSFLLQDEIDQVSNSSISNATQSNRSLDSQDNLPPRKRTRASDSSGIMKDQGHANTHTNGLGTSSPQMNGNSQLTNGAAPNSSFDREELIRIVLQNLKKLGYK
jgi:hypothetical protein